MRAKDSRAPFVLLRNRPFGCSTSTALHPGQAGELSGDGEAGGLRTLAQSGDQSGASLLLGAAKWS
ncbi:MAG TPA: hypothetical protein VEZ40_02995 [Pyrinomonadaceae bacterium]|nr:hypothetical protein [Pyrinomonadaceae bacterium]